MLKALPAIYDAAIDIARDKEDLPLTRHVPGLLLAVIYGTQAASCPEEDVRAASVRVRARLDVLHSCFSC